jgi:hypothetical protein
LTDEAQKPPKTQYTLPKLCLSPCAWFRGSKIDLIGAMELHFGPQEPLDTEALKKEHKNLDSGPFPAYFARRF